MQDWGWLGSEPAHRHAPGPVQSWPWASRAPLGISVFLGHPVTAPLPWHMCRRAGPLPRNMLLSVPVTSPGLPEASRMLWCRREGGPSGLPGPGRVIFGVAALPPLSLAAGCHTAGGQSRTRSRPAPACPLARWLAPAGSQSTMRLLAGPPGRLPALDTQRSVHSRSLGVWVSVAGQSHSCAGACAPGCPPEGEEMLPAALGCPVSKCPRPP